MSIEEHLHLAKKPTSIKSKARRVNFTDLMKDESEDLYVKNNTGRSKTIEAGSLACNVNTEMGMRAIQIPLTWVPINLAQQAERKSVLKSPDFRLMVSRGWVIIVPAEDAESMLSTREGMIESERANLILSGASREDLVSSDVEPEYDSVLEKVSPKIAEAIRREDISEAEQLSIIVQEEHLGLLTQDDKDFIRQESEFDKVKAYVANLMD